MKIYQTKTIEDYDALMVELEVENYVWSSGYRPTEWRKWSDNGKDTCIAVQDKLIYYSNTSFYNQFHPDIPIVEYKLKFTKENVRENMMYKGYHFTEGFFNSTTFNGIRVYVCADEKNGKYGFIELGKTYNNLGLTYNQPSRDVLTHLIITSIDKFENIEITPEKAVYRYTVDFIKGVESVMII